jgi:hypothetical protein
LPALVPLESGRCEVGIGSAGDDRNDTRDANLRAFLERPFHAVKLEDGEGQNDQRSGFYCARFSKRELDAIIGDRSNGPTPYASPGSNIEFLADISTKYASQVRRVIANQSRRISVHLVGKPAASRHATVPRSQ